MRRSKSTEEQTAFALKQVELGFSVAECCRKLGVSKQTLSRWKKKLGGLGVAEVRRLKMLEEENRKLQQLVADLSLDMAMNRTEFGRDSFLPRLERMGHGKQVRSRDARTSDQAL